MGQKFRDEAGNIWEMGQDGQPRLVTQGQAGPNVVIPQPQDPLLPGRQQLQGLQIQQAQQGLANAPTPNERALKEQLLAAQVESAKAAAEKARKGNAGANIGDAKTQARMGNLKALGQQIGRVRELYQQNLKGGVPNFIAGNIPEGLRPENGAFESAAAGLGEIGLAAFRVPGVGSQSDAELRQFVAANTPKPGDSDAKIEEKLRNLETRLGATMEAMGQAPKQEEQTVAPGSDEDYTPTPGAGLRRDPALAGAEAQYRKMLASGASPGQILEFLKSRGISANPGDVLAQARYVAQHGRGSVEKLDTSQIEMVRHEGNGIVGQIADSPLGAYGVAAANALTAGGLDEIVGATGGNAAQAQMTKDALRERSPLASLGGDISGAALGMTGVNAGLRLAGGRLAPLATKAGGLGGDALYGAAYGAGESNDDRLSGALTGAASAGAGNLAGRGIVSGLGRTVRGASSPNLQYLNSRNIPMTPGQMAGQGGMVGRGIRAVEDTLESVPFLGAGIKARKAEGLQAFNREAFKDALAPINQEVQEEIGQEAIGQAHDLVGNAYGDALGGVSLRPDGSFIRQTDDILKRGSAVPVMGEQFNYLIGQQIDPLFNPNMSGQNFQAALQALNKAKPEFNRQGIMGNVVADHTQEMRDAFIDLANRQAPGAMPQLNAANAANKNVSILGDAVTQAVNNSAESGMFTPAQLARQAVNNTKKFGGKKAAARGDVPFRELTEAGQAVLPNVVPNSGTTDRALATLALPAALGGSAAGSEAMGLDPSITASLAGLAALSTKKGNNLVQSMVLKRSPAVRSIGEEILLRRRLGGMFGAGGATPLLVGY